MSRDRRFTAELHKLCGKLRDGEITPAEAERLNAMLLESKAARRYYRTFLALASALEARSTLQDQIDSEAESDEQVDHLFDELLRLEEQAEVLQPVQQSPQKVIKSRPASGVGLTTHDYAGAASYLFKHAARSATAKWIAAAAIVLIAATVFIASRLNTGPTPQPEIAEGPVEGTLPNQPDTPAATPSRLVATLTAEQDAVWSTNSAEGGLSPGSPLRAGERLTLTQGFAEITTARGAVAILEAPATIELTDNDNALRLHSGKLVGICETESSKGFVVRTPHMTATDIGTHFGIEVTSGASELHVMRGEVEVVLPQSAALNQPVPRRLLQQEAVRVETGSDTVIAIPSAPGKFDGVVTTHRLAGTGVGDFTQTQAYPAWQIVNVDGVALPQAIDLRISGDDHSTGFAGDDRIGRWLNHRDERQPAEGSDRIVYTIQTEIVVPASIDLDRVTLNMLGYFDFSLVGIRFNDQLVKDLNAPKAHDKPLLLSMPASALGLRHGRNVVQFHIANDPGSFTGLLIQWQLTGIKSIGGTGL